MLLRRLMTLTTVLLPLAVAGLACGGCGDSGGGDSGGPPDFTATGGDGGGNDTDDDTDDTGDDTGDEPVVGEPVVKILGLLGLEEHPDMFCGADVTVLVGATEIGDRDLRLVLSSSASEDVYILDLEPEPDPTSADVFRFSFDGAQLTDPDKPLGLHVPHDGTFGLMAAAFADIGAPMLPENPGLFDQRTVTMDAQPPQLAVYEPNPLFDPPTLVGLASVSGVSTDDEQVGRVEIYFDGDLKQTLDAASDETTIQVFAGEVDLRLELTDTRPFEIRALDLCGNAFSWSVNAKVVRWPWLRTVDIMHLPGEKEPIINDSQVVDWNGDGYPDVLFATFDGVRVGLNGGDDAPGEFGTYLELTDDEARNARAADLDEDGDMDVVVVGKVKGGPTGTLLVVYRNLGDGQMEVTEIHETLIGDAEPRALLLEDFSNDGRHDVAFATNKPDLTLVFFKRNSPEGQEFNDDQCVLVPAASAGDAAPDAVAGAGGDVGGTLECPTLFNGPFTAGGVGEVTSLEAVDLTGDDGVPDDYLDIVVGSEDANSILVFPNRFAKEGLLDTAFQQATSSFVYPSTTQTQLKPEFFCVGNFVELDDMVGAGDLEYDHLDVIVGNHSGNTWRVLVGEGHGQFMFKEPQDGPLADLDIFSMSGTVGSAVTGIVCEDFDADGHLDFAILSEGSLMFTVHLGDGTGRFNQDPASPMINPVNEGPGFVVQSFARRMRGADFDLDGRTDLSMDYRGDGWSIYRNTTDEEHGVDFHATRLLVTPLGRNTASGGQMALFEIGDVTMDGKADVVAVSNGNGFTFTSWLFNYHPIAKAYRVWELDGKDSPGPTVFVWSQGTYTEDLPSYPASYDRFPRQIYPETEFYGPVGPQDMKIVDVAGGLLGAGAGPDGFNDLVLVGDPKSSSLKSKSHMMILANTAAADAGGAGFWDPEKMSLASHALFRPYDGGYEALTNLRTFEFINPADDPIPGVVVATNNGAELTCNPVPPLFRFCPWNPQKKPWGWKEGDPFVPFWDCWFPWDCDSFQDHITGGQAWDMAKLAVEGPTPGFVTNDPNVAGDILVLNQLGDSVTVFRYDEGSGDPSFPFEAGLEKAIGNIPKFMALGDLDKDGQVDLAATVDKNVFIAFGETGFEPFEAPVPVDRNDKVEQEGGVYGLVLSDLNADGFKDVVFSRKNSNVLAIYLSIGTKQLPDGSESAVRQFHGPIELPMCKTPSIIKTHAFGDDQCEDVLVLCESSGAIAMVINDTCDMQVGGGG